MSRVRCLSLLACWLGLAPVALSQETANYITHGPMLGRVSADGIGIWGRTARPGEFSVKYNVVGSDDVTHSEPTTTKLADDNTGVVYLSGLKPATKYEYELVIPDVPGSTGKRGTFRTLPSAEALIDPKWNPRGLFNFKFEFACGNNQNPEHSHGPYLPTFRTMNRLIRDDVDFAILNGDWLYESQRSYRVDQWLSQVNQPEEKTPQILKDAPRLTGVWQNYKHFLNQGEPLAEWHAHVPSYYTFDDHEILNDIWGAGTAGLRDRRAVFRDIGVRAWYDYLGWSNPVGFTQEAHFGRGSMTKGEFLLIDESADFTKLDLEQMSNLTVHWGTPTEGVNDNDLDGVGGDPNAGVYDIEQVVNKTTLKLSHAADVTGPVAYSIGRRSYFKMTVGNCDFFVLDTRSHRDMHDVLQPAKPGISMIGLQQREWLMDGMKGSDADFIFVVSSVNFMIPHVGGGKIRKGGKDEAWTVFLDEREKLIDFWDELKQPVFVLTGDLHNCFAAKITDNVWEFASGPHNSNNHWFSDEGDRPPNGKFQWGPRPVDIRWSTWFATDIARPQLKHPHYCVVQINNVFNNPQQVGETRLVAFPQPQAIIQYYDGPTGQLRYAESILANPREDGYAPEKNLDE